MKKIQLGLMTLAFAFMAAFAVAGEKDATSKKQYHTVKAACKAEAKEAGIKDKQEFKAYIKKCKKEKKAAATKKEKGS